MYDIIIIGAGVTGAFIARKLAQYNVSVLLLDKESAVGNVTSNANSAIIHSGYDPVPGTLKAKLNNALKNAPRERYAQILANDIVRTKVAANPALKEDGDRMKKIRGSALTTAPNRVGAQKEQIHIEDNEWEAIQAGAISPSNLKKILNKKEIFFD